jgi:hypothetical protein
MSMPKTVEKTLPNGEITTVSNPFRSGKHPKISKLTPKKKRK